MLVQRAAVALVDHAPRSGPVLNSVFANGGLEDLALVELLDLGCSRCNLGIDRGGLLGWGWGVLEGRHDRRGWDEEKKEVIASA